MTAANHPDPASGTTGRLRAAVEAAQVEVEAVLRDRMDYGTSGRLIADFGETYQSLAEHIAAALAASGDEGHDEDGGA